ncbi:peptide-methionine (S)-S-oxide reductase MsrA [Mucilaginibacter polytrichastri]|uniref:Peptide methionine sulfoxide reductase MsrA n=1 Tax=Mucilaginibacter polytrichastri TaxID=1302689 RepID=A0A1Q6A1J0_9SPHI|nr:peptide-methionine (S)-S-oxide reductase MsrA [Mucilaginibacter polytrichastri]OKS87887.1 Peptide methionine sulfoxide reductase MsrA [Mucilaginibacter polytrichastri]SFT27512.1 peptide-methionine (S)-S-oxide reductase [Mucilaginibacter polytrichastri]
MNLQKATFANGCFWCTEAIFQTLKGVTAVTSGYTGGEIKNPTYMEICNGDTGHAEAIEIEFDADVLTYDELLLVFFKTHNPTTLNRQGNDVGTQYRSAVFYHNNEQKQQAEAMIKTLTDEQVFDKPIVTQIVPADTFYKAEDYHQNYFNDNTNKPYCSFVIQPKLNKFAKEFTDKIKPELL